MGRGPASRGARLFFCCGCGARFFFLLWVRGRFAHSLAAGVGLGNPIGHGLRRGLSIFLLRVRGAFFFAVGAPLPGAEPVRRNPMGRGPASRGARLFFCCGCAARFFLLWVRGRFAHSLAAGVGLGNPIGHGLRRGLCGAGGARLFFCCGCAARFFFAVGAPLPGARPVRRNPMGRRPASRGARLFFCCGCAARFFFAVGARQVRSLTCCRGGPRESNWAWSPYRGLCGAGGGGGRVYFFAAGARRVFFLLWVRGRFAHSLAAGAGLGNPIGHGLRIGACAGPGGGGARLFFCCGCAARFFFCCGCALARGSAGQAECNGAWAGQPGGAFIFLLRVRGAFFFCCGCAAGSLTHLLPAASEHPLQKGIQGPWRVFFFAAGARALGGGRVYFFCCGCAARLFFAAGARAHSLTHSLAARRPESTNSKKAHNKKKARVPTLNRNPKTPALLIIPKP